MERGPVVAVLNVSDRVGRAGGKLKAEVSVHNRSKTSIDGLVDITDVSLTLWKCELAKKTGEEV